ncbi:ribosomal protein S18-alanine N-acetyltransferase [Oleiagrimonas sp. C23AA]|uniref:ribosomal protein S18-alanine N-acetyltransferase n=1 Tax=Oleiagrimonas sp. C23AA TaxID=2719047 RepID=UPI001421F0DF|nr:ribosomal protein S18-alanine N-acetyltransferase [Oleiagrimonas sp. C23AA]NII12013.1 ribosomal protein S18-alanine N-acetyltransferase [Oleiagrimonas sp. C23AA]
MVAVVQTPVPSMRAMRPEDIPAVFAIEQRAYLFPWTVGIFRDCLQAGHPSWVMLENNAIIGYGVISVGAGEAHVLNVCVAPEHQGRGLGRRMLRRLVDLARWHRCQRMFLEVRVSNLAAQHLYDSEGFNEIGRRPNYYPDRKGREDALVMARELICDDV